MSEEPSVAAWYGAAAQRVGLVGDGAGGSTLRLLVADDPAQSDRAARASREAVEGDGVFLAATVLVELS